MTIFSVPDHTSSLLSLSPFSTDREADSQTDRQTDKGISGHTHKGQKSRTGVRKQRDMVREGGSSFIRVGVCESLLMKCAQVNVPAWDTIALVNMPLFIKPIHLHLMWPISPTAIDTIFLFTGICRHTK